MREAAGGNKPAGPGRGHIKAIIGVAILLLCAGGAYYTSQVGGLQELCDGGIQSGSKPQCPRS